MKTTSNLQIVTLAHLSRSANKRRTLYEIMTEINQIFALIDTPYSPGTFYPAVKNLAKQKMININQSGCLIEPPGLVHLEAVLLNHPLPDSLTGILYRLIAANILANVNLRADAIRRIDIEMIKFDHTIPVASQESTYSQLAPNSIRQYFASYLRRMLIELRDGK